MIGEAAVYVANRVTGNALEHAMRGAAWAGVLAILMIGAFTFGLIALYDYLAPLYGTTEAAALIAGGCLGLSLLIATVPWLKRKAAKLSAATTSIETQPIAAADAEARDAIDYFGAAKVMATAFMFGFSAARQFKAARTSS